MLAPHGHLKSSNVLLNQNWDPLLSDYGLIPVINNDSLQDLIVAYKSPEYVQDGLISKKTDVWSLGILILEILTGHVPDNFLQQSQGKQPDLEGWVNSIRDKSPEVVFDKEMKAPKSFEGEMLKLLEIGFSCCGADVDKRPCIKDASERIEEVK